jgi:hypothetical protein
MLAREIEDLTLGEFTVIWAVRRQIGRGWKCQLSQHFSRFLGPASAADAADAASLLRAALHRPPSPMEVRDVSDIEETLLWYLWANQAGEASLANVLAFEVFGAGKREAAHRASAILAFLLAEAGVALPQPALFESQAADTVRDRAFEPRIARLLSGERVAVAAFRRWIVAAQQKTCASSSVAQLMHRHGVAKPAAAALNHIMMVTQSAALRPVQHKPPPCPMVSVDEARFLSALASSGEDGMAALDWLPPAARRVCGPALQGLRHYLLEAALSVPKTRTFESQETTRSWVCETP